MSDGRFRHCRQPFHPACFHPKQVAFGCSDCRRQHWTLTPQDEFSANHLTLVSRMEYRSCGVFIMLDHSNRRVYRLHDFTKAHAMESGSYYCVSGKVNSADKLYLVIESVKPDAKHNRSSVAPAHVDSAER